MLKRFAKSIVRCVFLFFKLIKLDHKINLYSFCVEILWINPFILRPMRLQIRVFNSFFYTIWEPCNILNHCRSTRFGQCAFQISSCSSRYSRAHCFHFCHYSIEVNLYLIIYSRVIVNCEGLHVDMKHYQMCLQKGREIVLLK